MPINFSLKLVNMATRRHTNILTDDDILNIFNEISSDEGDFDCDFDESSDSEYEIDINLNENTVESNNSEFENLQLEEIKDDFVWTQDNMFSPTVHVFDDDSSGVKNVDNFSDLNELGLFELFLSPVIMDRIVTETNKFASEVLNKSEYTTHARINKWKDVTVEELYVFLAVSLLMVRNKHLTINEHWSTDSLLESPIFSKLMTRDRYLLILKMLHFNDNNTNNNSDKLHKLRPIIDHCKYYFKHYLVPFQNICIDESLVLFKGRLFFKQYISSKRSRFGIKLFVLCDCDTGYILDFIVYCGKSSEIYDNYNLGQSSAVVTTLIEPYLNRGHSLFVDNYYSSPKLFSFLHNRKTNACGTVRKNRKHLPKLEKKLKIGETESSHTNSLLAIKWLDRREVYMLTTMHDDSMKKCDKINYKTKENILKPKCVIDYNGNMGAVDRSDLLLSSLSVMRKSVKWYKKLFFHFVDMIIINSYSLHILKSETHVALADFHLRLTRQIIEKYRTVEFQNKRGRHSTDYPLRLTERHFPSFVPATEKKKNATRKCVVCSKTDKKQKKRRETRYMCEICDVGLCVTPCFQEYHTKHFF